MDNFYVLYIRKFSFKEEIMGKTTVFIDDKLINEAIKAVGAKTKREVIEKGLKELIKTKNRQALRKELGTYDLDLSLNELERLRDEQ